ncbi:MAG TPA: hypothetical protein VN081_03750 [Dongiaceae bacterium]|nr:hypothetical protein [Dongiaceae bacterium]
MYSGTTFRHHSGNVVGVHQRIDRIAKRHLRHYLPTHAFFPTIKDILHFEGKNGPDGIKSKSPSIDEPWHYIKPGATADDPLVVMITDHLYNLSVALKNQDEIRAAFEAAWLSHAIVDGLTPAHHFPLAEKIEELWGKPHTERITTSDKILIRGTSKRDMLSKNWQYWGGKGVFSLHVAFEWGVASSITINQFKDIGIHPIDLKRVKKEGFTPLFLEAVRAVDSFHMYEEFARTGWSVRLGNISRQHLIPIISKTVVLAWYAASEGMTQ